MKPEHEQYILENIGRKPAETIAKDLGIEERKVKRFIERQKSEGDQPAAPTAAKSSFRKRNIVLSIITSVRLNKKRNPRTRVRMGLNRT